MRPLLKKELLRVSLQWAQRLFFTAAVVLLGYCGFVVADGRPQTAAAREAIPIRQAHTPDQELGPREASQPPSFVNRASDLSLLRL